MKSVLKCMALAFIFTSLSAQAESVEVYEGVNDYGLGNCTLEVVRDDNGRIIYAGDAGLYYAPEMKEVDGRYIGSTEAGASIQTLIIDVEKSNGRDIPKKRTVIMEPIPELLPNAETIALSCLDLKVQE